MEEQGREVVVIDNELKKKIKETVTKILQRSNLYEISELKAREEASAELDLDLSQKPYEVIVREAVESFIEKALSTIESEIGKRHDQIVQDIEGGGSAKTTSIKKKKKNSKNKKTGKQESTNA